MIVVNGSGTKRKFFAFARLKYHEKGYVLAARDSVGLCTVVIKVDTSGGAHVKRERQFYELLQGCPNVPRMVWFGEDVDSHHIVLAIDVLGIPLSCMRFRLSKDELQGYASDIGRALRTMHTRGIVHRDVKPSNVVVRNRKAYLVDFDCSALLNEPLFSFAGQCSLFCALHALFLTRCLCFSSQEHVPLLLSAALLEALPFRKTTGFRW